MAVNISQRTGNVKNKRSHALNATKKRQNPNLQTYTIDGEKVVMTAREARTMRKSEKACEVKNIENTVTETETAE